METTVPVFVLFIVLGAVLLVSLFVAFLNGTAMQKLMQSKGYTDNWFWQGFFFGPFAFLGASQKGDRGKADLPEYVQEAIRKATEEHDLATGGWRCANCQTVNPATTGTCVCGKSRFENGASSTAK